MRKRMTQVSDFTPKALPLRSVVYLSADEDGNRDSIIRIGQISARVPSKHYIELKGAGRYYIRTHRYNGKPAFMFMVHPELATELLSDIKLSESRVQRLHERLTELARAGIVHRQPRNV
jgi:hypothetical protein